MRKMSRNFRQVVFIALAVGIGLLSVAPAKAQSTQPSDAKKLTFLVVYSPGPAWVKGKPAQQQPLKEHFAYLVELYRKGILKFGGPFADGSGGAAVIEAATPNEAAALIQNDPAAKAGIMVPKITEWPLVTWDKIPKK